IIRLILENKLRINLFSGPHLLTLYSGVSVSIQRMHNRALLEPNKKIIGQVAERVGHERMATALIEQLDADATIAEIRNNVSDLPAFVTDRLKIALKEKGTRHDLIDAVFSLGNEDDLVRLVARVKALQAFLTSDDGTNLLAGYKRAANI